MFSLNRCRFLATGLVHFSLSSLIFKYAGLSDPISCILAVKGLLISKNIQSQQALYFEDIMFGIGLPEMILILALALIVVGPDKLPELARSVAKGVLELKKTVSALKENLADENPFESVKPELEEAAKSLKEKLADPVASEWKGILPDDGVNPVSDDEHSTIIESELLSEKDQESLAEMDIAQENVSPDTAVSIESPAAETGGNSENQPASESNRQDNQSLPS